MKLNTMKVNKLTLRGYYEKQKIAQLTFVQRVAKECHVSTRTVYNWINGKYPVPVLAQNKINEIIGQQIEYSHDAN